MRLGVFGIGYVGAVSAACLARDGHDVVAVDNNMSRVQAINRGISPVSEVGLQDIVKEAVAFGSLRATTHVSEAVEHSEVCMICVGTPSTHRGELDTGQLERVAEEIGEALKSCVDRKVLVVRSTVLPCTTRLTLQPIIEAASGKQAGTDFDLVVHPEFLREGKALDDYRTPSRIVIGELEKGAGDRVAELYRSFGTPYIRVSLEAAEMIKYVDNAWHALKVGFANEIGGFCKKIGLDSHVVMDAFCADTKLNISSAYLRPGYAFGGSCLPKDVRALSARFRTADFEAPIINSIIPSNVAHMQRGLDLVMSTGSRKIGILGIAFKAGTDDLRESPLVELAERLIGKGCDVKIYDQYVQLNSVNGSDIGQRLVHIPHIAERLYASLDDVLESSDLLVIGNSDPAYGAALLKRRPRQKIIDLVRIDAELNLSDCIGICW